MSKTAGGAASAKVMHSIPKNSRAFLMKMDPLRMLNLRDAICDGIRHGFQLDSQNL